jgi:natural product precursor
MKKQIKRLSLSKETLRNLSDRDMTVAVGGASLVACSNPCITEADTCSESCPSFRCQTTSAFC